MTAVGVPYQYGGRQFKGMLVYDDTVTAKRLAILMQPDWLGVCAHSIDMAHDVAGKDYVVMIADMFGAGYGERKKDFDELMKISRVVRNDLPFVLGCGSAADEALTAEANRLGIIEPDKKCAIGYCIGGGIVLEQARDGAEFNATVAFHVTLPNPLEPKGKKEFRGRVLIFHGSADPVTPPEQINTLESELTDANVDWQLMMFGHAGHSFCDKDMYNEYQRYDEKLCNQSYRIMRDFFSETL